MIKIRFLVLLLILPVLLFSATLKVALLNDIDTWDPHKILDIASSAVVYSVCEPLVTFDADSLKIVPCLAESWKHSANFKTWTYILRKGVTFHDGTPLTAADVVRTFTNTPNFDASAKTVDARTITFTLAAPNARFNDLIAQPYYVIYKMLGKKGEGVIGTGPFMFKSWDKGKTITLAANPKWWQGKVKIDTVQFVVFHDQASLLDAMIAKKIDLAQWLASKDVLALRKYHYLHVMSRLGMNTAFMSMNVTHKPFDDPRVRRAVAMAIDRATLTKKYFASSSGAPARCMLPVSMFKTPRTPIPYDPTKAKALLKESGVDLSRPLTLLPIWAPRPYMPDPDGIAADLKSALESVGFHVKITPDPDHYFDRIKTGDYDICLHGWIADNGDPVGFMAALLYTQSVGYNNVPHWSNPQFDALIDKCRSLSGYQLKQTVGKILDLVKKDVPLVPLFWGAQSAIVNERVKGFKVHPSSQLFLWRVSVK